MKRIAVISMLIAAMAVPAVAQASDGYGNVAGATQGSSTTGGPTNSGSASTSSPAAAVATTGGEGSSILPFTGLQLAMIFGAGVLLLGTGLLLRRARIE